jgi:predicted kinase
VPVRLVWVTARDTVLAARIAARRALAADPSEATLDILRAQQDFVEVPGADELGSGLLIDTSDGVDLARLAAALREPAQ